MQNRQHLLRVGPWGGDFSAACQKGPPDAATTAAAGEPRGHGWGAPTGPEGPMQMRASSKDWRPL
eukprot:8211040-Pyramimonas_sp.AAC.1